MQQEDSKKSHKKKIQGVVVSDKMQKTVVVAVTTIKEHPKDRKRYKTMKKYKAHDEANKFHTGDVVVIEESRPLSKDKQWVVEKKVNE